MHHHHCHHCCLGHIHHNTVFTQISTQLTQNYLRTRPCIELYVENYRLIEPN